MPIFFNYAGLDGDVTSYRSGGASGGVWKTTNFLTNDPGVMEVSRISFGGRTVDGRDAMATLKVVALFERAKLDPRGGTLYVGTDQGVYSEPVTGHTRLIIGDDQGVWRSGGVLNSHNTGALRNVSNNNTSAGVGSMGALQNVAGNNTWAGAARPSPGQGVLKSADGGRTWRTGRAMSHQNNLKQIALLCHSYSAVEIIVSDPGSVTGRVFRLKNVTIGSAGRIGSYSVSYTGLE